jgi:multimeric flavodoxin WrbA
MKKNLYLICPETPSNLQKEIHDFALQNKTYTVIDQVEKISEIHNGNIIVSVHLDATGINMGLLRMLKHLSFQNKDYFKGSCGAIILVGDSELFTKSVIRKIIFHLNLLGVSFIGRPVVEGTASLMNLVNIAGEKQISLKEALLESAKELVDRLILDQTPKKETPELLVLHSSNYKTSNTLMLWEKVKKELNHVKVNEIHIENGSVEDCIGCPFKTCQHYGEQKRCYYGGIMVTDVYPAILDCDGLLLLCPNYNDAISANLSAVINRLTALFRRTPFYDKHLFSIIVSGHSGSDIIAEQLISALCINKTFRLPPHFCMMETANNPGDILQLKDIDQRALSFSKGITEALCLSSQKD